MRRLGMSLAGVLLAGWIAGTIVPAAEPAAKETKKLPFTATDWPWWRGPDRNGHAAANQNPPLTWSATENVVWKTAIPGRGHSSPTIVGEQIFLTTADIETGVQSVLCIRRSNGELLWKVDVHEGGLEQKGNGKTTLASSTVACDGERLFVNFLNGGFVHTTCLNRDGKKLWQTKVTDFLVHQGFGSSPAIYESLVLVTADSKGTGLVAALDRATGEIVWKQERPKVPNYTSPIILNVAGKDQLIMTGCELVSSFDPLTGKKLWEIPGSTTECVTSTVTDGEHIFTSGGYPKNHLSAVKADGSGKIAWENNTRVYVPSMLIREGYLYAVLDAGVVTCWKSDTGKEQWKHRLGGTFSASPVLVGERIYVTNEAGETFVFKADPTSYEPLGMNTLGKEVFATPTFVDNCIYMRVAESPDGKRQEFLYCLGDVEATRKQ